MVDIISYIKGHRNWLYMASSEMYTCNTRAIDQ